MVAVVLGLGFANVIPGFHLGKAGGGPGPAPGQYSVTFSEAGLTKGTPWSVTLAGSTRSSSSSTVQFTKGNGSYAFSVGGVSGYTASPSSGTVTVNGASVTQSVAFSPSAVATYAVTFTESGLPSGTAWSVALSGAGGSGVAPGSIAFNEANGTYSFMVGSVAGYTANPPSGSVTVNGAAVTQAIVFSSSTAPLYLVTFTESGLPSGTAWSVLLNGVTGGASAPGSIVFSEPNGTYSFTVGSVAGYTASPRSGSVTVNGAAVTQAITFSPSVVATYAVTFAESGLPNGTAWSVTLSGAAGSAVAPGSIAFSESNGTYSFTVGSVTGYAASPSSGGLAVSGSPKTQSITFSRSGGGGGGGLPPILGLPGVEGYVVVGTTVAVAVIVGVLVALHTYAAVGGAAVAGGAGGRRALRRRRKGGKTPPPSGAAPPARSAGAPPTPPPAGAGVGPPPPPVPPPSPPASAAPGASAVCGGCGKPYVGAEKFCTACGRPR